MELMAVSTMTSKGHIKIPAEIRRHLMLGSGDRLEFLIESDGKVVLVAAKVDIADLKGILAPAPRRASLKVMDAVIHKRAARR